MGKADLAGPGFGKPGKTGTQETGWHRCISHSSGFSGNGGGWCRPVPGRVLGRRLNPMPGTPAGWPCGATATRA